MVGELNLEDLMNDTLLPTGIVFKKRNHRIYAKVQHDGAERRIKVEISEG